MLPRPLIKSPHRLNMYLPSFPFVLTQPIQCEFQGDELQMFMSNFIFSECEYRLHFSRYLLTIFSYFELQFLVIIRRFHFFALMSCILMYTGSIYFCLCLNFSITNSYKVLLVNITFSIISYPLSTDCLSLLAIHHLIYIYITSFTYLCVASDWMDRMI